MHLDEPLKAALAPGRLWLAHATASPVWVVAGEYCPGANEAGRLLPAAAAAVWVLRCSGFRKTAEQGAALQVRLIPRSAGS